jgi:hypothetical protein
VVPFSVVDPATNAGRSVFVSRGQRNTHPTEAVALAYACGVRTVWLLGLAGGWAQGAVGTRVGTLSLRYTDGTLREVPLRLGLEVDDWVGHAATGSILAAKAPGGGPGSGHLDALAVDCGLDAERTLAEVHLRADTPRTALTLFAVTLGLAPDGGLVPEAEALARDQVRSEARRCTEAIARVRDHGFVAEAKRFRQDLDEILAEAPASLAQAGRAGNRLLVLASELAACELRRRLAKAPDLDRRDAPTPVDYMVLLERVPLWAEKGWRPVPNQGADVAVFGQGDDDENSLRSLGNLLFVYAFLATAPDYDAQVSGVPRQHLRERALCGLRYMTRSHVTGDLTCLNGKRWGNHWQSAWWTGKLAAAAHLLWSDLGAADRTRIEQVVTHEADRHLPRKAPGGEFGNTRSEENAWDAEVLTWAASLFPAHPNAPAWQAKAREFMVNTLSVRADRLDGRLVDGRPVREQVYTVNVHDDFTIENHGAYQFCYMACPLHSLAWSYYACLATGRPPPEALFHHVGDVWEVIRGTYLYDSRFAYLGGKDWARYVYGLYFIMPALVMLQQQFGDRDARLIERERFRLFEWEQRQHGDGGLFSGRFTHNTMSGWPHEYETDAMALLALCARLHGDRPPLPAADPDDLQRRLAGVRFSPDCEWAYARSPRAFASFSWRLLEKGWSMGLFVPAGGDHLAEWGRNNLSGVFLRGDREATSGKARHTEQQGPLCFATTGEVPFSPSPTTPPDLVQTLSFIALPEHGLALVIDRAVAQADLALDGQRPLNLHLPNDIFNGNRRTLYSAEGEHKLTGVGGSAGVLRIASPWLNVDQTLGLVSEPGTWTIHDAATRNAPWQSLLYELVSWNQQDQPRTLAAGTVARDAVFVLLAANARTTRRVARGLERLSPPGAALGVFRLSTPDGARITLAANHGVEAVGLGSLPVPLAGARWLLPAAQATGIPPAELPAGTVAVWLGR